MDEFLSFRKMLTPVIIKGVCLVGGVAAVGFGIMTMLHGQFFLGLISIPIGVIGVRVYCELMIVLFRIYDSLEEIRKNTAS